MANSKPIPPPKATNITLREGDVVFSREEIARINRQIDRWIEAVATPGEDATIPLVDLGIDIRSMLRDAGLREVTA